MRTAIASVDWSDERPGVFGVRPRLSILPLPRAGCRSYLFLPEQTGIKKSNDGYADLLLDSSRVSVYCDATLPWRLLIRFVGSTDVVAVGSIWVLIEVCNVGNQSETK